MTVFATPRFRTSHEFEKSFGPKAVNVCSLAKQQMDGWQSDFLHDALATRPDGKWLTRECALIVPRQNGKGGVLEALALLHLFVLDSKLILWTAHEFKTAKDAFRRMVGLIESNQELRSRVKIRYQGGEETIEVLPEFGGARLRFLARSGASGRGFSADLVILDEAYDLTDDQLSAILPTVIARPNPQIWYTSSAPLPTSNVLRRVCKRGRAGDASITYQEFCAEPDDRLDDPYTWGKANPAFRGRLDPEAIQQAHESMSPENFQREILGVWLEDEFESVIDLNQWAKLAISESKAEKLVTDTIALAVDVTPDRGRATIAAATVLDDDTWLLEVIENDAGTSWVVPRLVDLVEMHQPVAVLIDGASPAASLIPDIEARGLRLTTEPERGFDEIVYRTSATELSSACGALYDAVTDSENIRHLGDDALSSALEKAAQRPMGDSSWAWSRKLSSADISPLVAVTLARFGLAMWGAEDEPKPVVFFG